MFQGRGLFFKRIFTVNVIKFEHEPTFVARKIGIFTLYSGHMLTCNGDVNVSTDADTTVFFLLSACVFGSLSGINNY